MVIDETFFLTNEEKEIYEKKYKKKKPTKRKLISKKPIKGNNPKVSRKSSISKLEYDINDVHDEQSTINPPLGTFTSHTVLLTNDGIRYLLVYKTSKGMYRFIVSNIQSELIDSKLYKDKEPAYAAKAKYIEDNEIESSPGIMRAILDLEHLLVKSVKEVSLIYNLLIDPNLRERYSIPPIKDKQVIKKIDKLNHLSKRLKRSIRGLN